MYEMKKYYLDNGKIYYVVLGDDAFKKYKEKDGEFYCDNYFLGNINCIIYCCYGINHDLICEKVVYSR